MGMSTHANINWQDSDKIIGRSLHKSLISLAIPAVLSVFFTFVFEIIDMYWIGKLESDSIAALGAASFFVWMLRGLGLTVATGAIALVARRTGEKNEQGLIDAIADSIGSALLFSLLTFALLLPLALNIFHWLGLEPTVTTLATEYTVVFLTGLIFVYLMEAFEYIIRGVGDTKTPMIITGLSLLLNAILDPVFIFSFKMGLKGAAYATILSQCLGAFLMAAVLLKKIPALKKVNSWRRHTRSKKSYDFFRHFYGIIKIGGPVGLSDAGFSLIYLGLTGIISEFGTEPLAALAISHRLEGLPFFICLGVSMAVAPIVGQFLGAGLPENARESAVLALKITVVIILIISILFFLFAPVLYKLFTSDGKIISHGVDYLRTIAIFEIFLVFEVVLGGVFSGSGDTKPVLWVTFPLTALRIPLSYLFAVVIGLGTLAIWGVIAFTTFLKGSILLYLFKKGKWLNKKV